MRPVFSCRFALHPNLACSAVVVSTLPQTLATCDGPYRFHVANSEAGAFMWSHVSDERCTMLHDKAGNSVISMEKPATLDQAMIAAVAQGAEVPEEWWAGITREAGKASSAGQGGNVVCTSAGQTTRTVLDLMEPGQRNVVGSSGGNNDAVRNIEPNTSNVESFRLSSLQDGSIISSSYNFFHIRVSRNSRKVELAQGPTVGNLADLPNPQTTASGAALTEEKHINITVGGIVAPSVSLERASTEGVLLSVEGRAGTWVFEIYLFQTSVGVSQETPSDREEGCLAETVLILEIFSADTQIVHRRRSTEVILSSGGVAGGLEAAEGDYRMIRVVFLVDLKVVDGYKLSTLHLMKHLPSNFRASTLDLSCACESSAVPLPCKQVPTPYRIPFAAESLRVDGEKYFLCPSQVIRAPKTYSRWNTDLPISVGFH